MTSCRYIFGIWSEMTYQKKRNWNILEKFYPRYTVEYLILFWPSYLKISTIIIQMLKMAIFLANFCPFLVHKLEKSKFLARIHMKYFHLGIFVIPRVYLIRKYGYQTQAFFFVFHRFFDTVKGKVFSYVSVKNYHSFMFIDIPYALCKPYQGQY